MASFEIPDGASTVTLAGGMADGKPAPSTGSVVFTVTNRTDQPLSCRLKVAPRSDARNEWFSVQGERERPFAASETQKVTVNVAVPPEVRGGDLGFRLQALNVNNPGNDYAESAIVTLALPKISEPKPRRWLPWLIAAVLVLAVGGVAAWVVLRPKPPAQVTVPNVSKGDMLYTDAEKALTKMGLQANRVSGEAKGATPDTVVAQTPAPGAPLPQDKTVALTVDPGVRVPANLIGVAISDAIRQQLKQDFDVRELDVQTRDLPQGVIAGLNPPPGQPAAKGGPLQVYVTCNPLLRFRCRHVRPLSDLHQLQPSRSQ